MNNISLGVPFHGYFSVLVGISGSKYSFLPKHLAWGHCLVEYTFYSAHILPLYSSGAWWLPPGEGKPRWHARQNNLPSPAHLIFLLRGSVLWMIPPQEHLLHSVWLIHSLIHLFFLHSFMDRHSLSTCIFQVLCSVLALGWLQQPQSVPRSAYMMLAEDQIDDWSEMGLGALRGPCSWEANLVWGGTKKGFPEKWYVHYTWKIQKVSQERRAGWSEELQPRWKESAQCAGSPRAGEKWDCRGKDGHWPPKQLLPEDPTPNAQPCSSQLFSFLREVICFSFLFIWLQIQNNTLILENSSESSPY